MRARKVSENENASRMKVIKAGIINGQTRIETECRSIYRRVGIHWLRKCKDGSWLKVRSTSMPVSVLNKYKAMMKNMAEQEEQLEQVL